MTSEKWRTAWEIYSDARDLSPAERQSFLDAVQPEPDVLQEVLLLLDEPDEPALEEVGSEHKAWLASFAMGRYKLLDYLGKGGVSEVYSAQDQQLGRIVALKFLLPGTLGARSTERVMCEAKTLSSLNHPNIVTVYEVIESASGLAIVMELVEGRALRSLCGTSLGEDQVIRIGQQIAQALAAAHAHGIVHRDIKPENILVRPDGYVKVVDFGLARQMAADGSTSTFGVTAGTLQYMSPEQVQGSSVSPASDIFSVGLVLYELAAGHHPFTAESSIQSAYSIATKRTGMLVGREQYPHLAPSPIDLYDAGQECGGPTVCRRSCPRVGRDPADARGCSSYGSERRPHSETQNLVECAGACWNGRRGRCVVCLLHSGLHAVIRT